MVVVPLVLTTIAVGSASVGDLGKLGRLASKTLLYFCTTTVAVFIGLLFANILKSRRMSQPLYRGTQGSGRAGPQNGGCFP